jgi:predicted transposase/invertase (TIGR01784 family)
MEKIHDRGYRKLFSNLEIFRQLVTSFVREPWVKDLDFSTCELLKDSFVSKQYKGTFSDLIYKVKLRGRDFYIAILLEFKATPYRFVALQILGYIVDFYRHLLDSQKRLRKLSPVFPIMLYRGEKRWRVPVNFSGLVDGNDLLGRYALNFEYFPILENAFSKEVLLKIGNIVSTLFLAEVHYDIDLLERELLALFRKSRDKKAVSLLLNWFKQLALRGKIDESDYRTLERVYDNPKEVNMLINAIKKEKKQLYDQGKKEGKKEGKALQRAEFAKLMLSNGEPLEKIKYYTGLSLEALKKLESGERKNGRQRALNSSQK